MLSLHAQTLRTPNNKDKLVCNNLPISMHVHTMCRLYAHLKVSHEWSLKKSVPGLQMHTLCIQFVQIFCTLSRVSWKSVLKVCICALDAYILQTTCKLYALPWVYFDLVLGRWYFGAIEMSCTLVATCFLHKIPSKKIWLSVHTHHMHTLIWCMHTWFGRMHTLFRHWKPHLISRVLQTPSQVLLV